MADVRMQMVVAVVRNEKKKNGGMLKRIFMVMNKNIFSMMIYYK